LSIVAGIDFGTLSVRVSLFSKSEGRLGTGVAEYPLHRSAQDPNFATQSHRAQMDALEGAMRSALRESGVSGDQVRSLALDTTGSSVIPVGETLEPLDDYYLWCDHRAWREAQEITPLHMSKSWRPSIGAGVSIPPSGASQNSCTGCDTIRRNALPWSPRSRIAT
jgi:L-ribulokinase